jgi:hypothetical protein
MADLVERLETTAAERKRTTAHDIPDHYLHVVAKISQADGVLMEEAAAEITRLKGEVEKWKNKAEAGEEVAILQGGRLGIMSVERDRLRAEVERLSGIIQCASSQLAEGLRIAATDTLAQGLPAAEPAEVTIRRQRDEWV